MELRFIYIKQYKNIKDSGFNFSNKTQDVFMYDGNTLFIQPSKEKTPSYFFGENINGVTGIVGANGSGKTNLSEFINKNLSHVTNGGLGVYSDGMGLIILDKLIFIHESLKLENIPELEKLGYVISRHDNAPLDKGQRELKWHEMEKNKYIYYNPVFDFRLTSIHGNLQNISTSYLVYNDVYNTSKSYKDESISSNRYYKTSQLESYYMNERNREAEFVLEFGDSNKFIDFAPNRLALIIDHISENQLLLESYISEKQIETNPELKIKKKNIGAISEIESDLNREVFRYSKIDQDKTAIETFNISRKDRHLLFKRTFLIKLFKLLILYDDLIIDSEKLSKFIFSGFDLADLDISKYSEKLKNILTSLDLLIQADETNDDSIEVNNYTKFDHFQSTIEYEKNIENMYRSLILNTSYKEILQDLIKEMQSLLNGQSIIHLELIGKYSSGQQQMLNFYSRFFYAYQQIKKNESTDYGIVGENIVIFIDEGEVALHPEWQRHFFNNAINFLGKLFSDYTLQFILTTHSPFVISEIPKNDIIFLNKDANGVSIQLQIEKEKTFAGNIHELLADSFFMRSTMGSFSEKKIKEIIDFYYVIIDIKDNLLGEFREKYALKQLEYNFIVNSIGDEVVANILKNHLSTIESKLSFNTSNVSDRIAELEKELSRLKKMN